MSRQPQIGATWWSQRFLESLESVMAGRLAALGRSYARRGQVLNLEIGAGVVAATLEGGREDPYVVRLRMPVVPPEDWDRIVGSLVARAGYAARMLAGELPSGVEEVFAEHGASLLPAPHARLVTECTCPEWENPCPHIAAVCYVLAGELDRQPFSLFAWRGMGRDELLAALRSRRRQLAGATADGDDPGSGELDRARDERGDDPLDLDVIDLYEPFWVAGHELALVRVEPQEAEVASAALRLAPRKTIRVRGGDLVDVLAPAYRVIAAAAAERARR